MSEYQYYEFQAIDRPLTQAEMAELRALSTRARITPTRLQNEYSFGDFKGDPRVLMERYFDAFVYVANWGTHRLMLRLPRRLLDPKAAWPYAVDDSLDVRGSGEFVILDFTSQDEEGSGWITKEEAEGWMPSLLSLRSELAEGDLRALHLSWLSAAEAELIEDDETEPPVPPGLGSLSASLKALAEFLRVDDDLLAAAAERSDALPASPSEAGIEQWITALPASEKDAWLLRAAKGNQSQLGAEILRRFRREHAPPADARTGTRTARELLSAAEGRATARQRQEAERKAAEQARRQREQAAARARHLDSLVGREEELWRSAESLIDTTQQKAYDQALQLLADLRDLSARQQQKADFAARLDSLRVRNARRPSLIERLNRGGLGA